MSTRSWIMAKGYLGVAVRVIYVRSGDPTGCPLALTPLRHHSAQLLLQIHLAQDNGSFYFNATTDRK